MKRTLLTLSLITICLLSDQGLALSSEIPAQTVALEAANQSSFGQYLVASVIVNRAKERGQTLDQVCLARKQFSAWNDPRWAKAWLARHYTQTTRHRARNALERAIREPFKEIDHYHTVNIMPYWAKGHKPIIVEGNHAFYNLN